MHPNYNWCIMQPVIGGKYNLTITIFNLSHLLLSMRSLKLVENHHLNVYCRPLQRPKRRKKK